MMQSIRHIFLGLSAVLLVLPAGTAFAGEKSKKVKSPVNYEAVLPSFSGTMGSDGLNIEQFAQRNNERGISASQAKSAAQRSRPGAKFVNIQMSGRDTYRVRMQEKNGRIVDVYVDARTGRVKN